MNKTEVRTIGHIHVGCAQHPTGWLRNLQGKGSMRWPVVDGRIGSRRSTGNESTNL